MKRVRATLRKFRFVIVSMTLLFLSFSVNIFGIGDSTQWFYGFQQDSSYFVKKATICKSQQSYYSGMLLQRVPVQGETSSCAAKDNIPYGSQFGLQSRVVRFFAPSDSTKFSRYFGAIELLLAFATALIMTAVVVRTRSLYGTIPAITLLAGICISPWIVAYARNIYWVFPFMIAPFALVYCGYPWFTKKGLQWAMYIGVFLLVLLKLLDGYEHVITIIVSVMAALTIYEYKNFRDSWKRLLVRFIMVGLVGALAFVSAFAINVIGLNEYYHTSDRSISEIEERAAARGAGNLQWLQPYVLFGFEHTLPDVYAALDHYGNISALKDGNARPVYYVALSALNYILLPGLNYPIRGSGLIWTALQSICFLAVAGFVAAVTFAKRQKKNRDNSLLAAMVVGLLGAVGWLVIMPGHAYPHAHLNAIVFYIPFLLFCYIAIGRYIAMFIDRVKARVSKK